MIEQLAKDGMTMIIVTHEVAFAHEVADLVAFMSDGVIVESGRPANSSSIPKTRAPKAFSAAFTTSWAACGQPANSVFDGKIVGKIVFARFADRFGLC